MSRGYRSWAFFDSDHGGRTHRIHTYRWAPYTIPTATVFLLHGFRNHTGFNFLRSDSSETPTKYGVYEGSFVEQLVDAGMIVFAHDHIGHGRTPGTRGYFDSISQLVEDTLQFVDHTLSTGLANIPTFLVGHSLGGSIAIMCAKARPNLFTGCIFSSAAVEPPTNMLGVKGKIMAPLSALFSRFVPEMEVLAMPRNDNEPDLHTMFMQDPLCSDIGVRARVGHEFLCLYHDLSLNRDEITVPFLYAAGGRDTLVNPDAGQRFFDQVSSSDKEYISFPNSWHNLFIEKDNEEVRRKYLDWIVSRIN